MLPRLLATLLLVAVFSPIYTLAGQGCCSRHGGQDYCSDSGRWVCQDGTYSPTCTCYAPQKSKSDTLPVPRAPVFTPPPSTYIAAPRVEATTISPPPVMRVVPEVPKETGSDWFDLFLYALVAVSVGPWAYFYLQEKWEAHNKKDGDKNDLSS